MSLAAFITTMSVSAYACDEKVTSSSVQGARADLPSANAHPIESYDINIAGLDKKVLFASLFDGAHEVGRGIGMGADAHKEITPGEWRDVLGANYIIEYLRGRSMHVNLSGEIFNSFLYDRDNGPGKAQAIIATLNSMKLDIVDLDIAGLEKRMLLNCLFAGAKMLNPETAGGNCLTLEEWENFVAKGHKQDVIRGLPMYVDLNGDTLNASLYNKANGNERAQDIVATIRKLLRKK